ncbi:DNA polymerase III subunit [Riemerella columbipharyngis]|uniref:DNA polymerase-3 subunit delta n=1 Tax=Riemerella columbipharyngis TaxID=1071918 RepID=A0A1G7BN07_9FLAO|nr:DNA polymerase III subunit delta' [Riemerella columbipharyngis]SDE28551.1 DNA polymerase-3 subunit delta' [Riemerella columbipharyngis]
MKWDDIIGQDQIKSVLLKSIDNNRISHAQLFVGKMGYGTLPLALLYALEILKREHSEAEHKVSSLNHMDLHFSFPIFKGEKNALSQSVFNIWRDMILNNPYADYQDWISALSGNENKQIFISPDEISAITQSLSLKTFEGGTKILIIWGAEKMSENAANKFLKFLEEPPEKTVIILLATSTDNMLQTILSRCQILNIPKINDDTLLAKISETIEDESLAREILIQAQGDYNTAKRLINHEAADQDFEDYFIQWVRTAFQARSKPQVLKDIINWANTIALWSTEKQKNFLNYCTEVFRLALLQNYGTSELVYKKIMKNNFNWKGFSNFISGANIEGILNEISQTHLHLVRNGNAKILWTDMGIKLTRYLHLKP